MAINDTITKAPAQTPAQTQVQNPVFNQNVRDQLNPKDSNQGYSMHSFHRRPAFGAAPLGRSIGSEVLKSLTKALTELMKEADPDVEATIIPVDRNNETALSFSALVLCLRMKKLTTMGVAYYTMIIEDTGEVIEPVFQNIGTQKVRLLKVTGDAWNSRMIETVLNKVKLAFPQTQYFSAESCVIPRGFDATNERLIHSVALNAIQAANIELTIRVPNFVDYQIQSAAHDSNLIVNLNFSREQRQNAVGEPMRSDVYLTFNSKQNNGNRQYDQMQGPVDNLNNGDTNVNIAEISGFMDVFWASQSNQGVGSNMFAPVQQQQGPQYFFGSRFIMTNMEAVYASTVTFQLLALLNALAVRDNNVWIQAFKPQPRIGNSIDIHDIGALGIEANWQKSTSGFSEPIPTSKDKFRDEDLYQMIGTYFRPGLTISLDVPECGPQTWYSNLFAVASNGDPQSSAAATDIIYNAANQLTNGLFAKYHQRNEPMFTDRWNRIHNGYYIDSNGVKRDLRDIDYLAVANSLPLLGNDPRAITAWSDTFLMTERPLAMRLEDREKIINVLTRNTAVFTGFSQRVTFRTKTLDALAQAAAEAGLKMAFNAPMAGTDFNTGRGTASFIDESASVSSQSSIFSRFGGPTLNNAGNFMQHNSRYGRY